jgi:hypothetical protein
MWLAALAATTADDMKEEIETCLHACTAAPIDYNTTQATLLESTDGIVFLMMLAGNQVCVVHSLGQFSSGLGGNTPGNNRIFAFLGEKMGNQLPPIVMVPSTGLIPWLAIRNHHKPRDGDLAELADRAEATIA